VNFFEHQARARQRTVFYLLLFIVAAALVVLAIDVVVVIATWWIAFDFGAPVSVSQWVAEHPVICIGSSILTALCIAGASFYRLVSLAGGGGAVAQELGAERVHGQTSDLHRRQLVNVVEEMAIAAGVQVPEVYVLEEEVKVNAFTAGYAPSNAAIIVTRGALDVLSREELQGVVAHEFSHILNGDTRLNTRLIGVLFGILFIGLAGRLILRGSAEAGGRVGAVGLAIGAALAAVGFSGLMLGRLIQAAVSRSRERLADASAVQFTRNPGGLAMALKKIAVRGSTLINVRSDEVSHMLVADGRKFFDRLFATHPQIIERIRAIEPRFNPKELEHLTLPSVASRTAVAPASRPVSERVPAAAVVAAVGNPGPVALALAADRRAALPESLVAEAHSLTGSPLVLIALALSRDGQIRRTQIDRSCQQLGLVEDERGRMEKIANAVLTLDAPLSLALAEIAFPALRRHRIAALRSLGALIDELIHADSTVTVFEYALARLLRLQIYELAVPQGRRRRLRPLRLHAARGNVQALFSILAQAGHAEARTAQAAYVHAIARVYPMDAPAYMPPLDWVKSMDHALMQLDLLAPEVKAVLIEALANLVMHDGSATTVETELLRVICAGLHCPLPAMMVVF